MVEDKNVLLGNDIAQEELTKELQENETIPALLELQVQNSIYMEKTLQYLKEQGVDTVIEIGPGKTLSGFVKRTVEGMECYSIEDMQGLQKVLEIFS